jgi:hypothetical protein
MAAKLASIVILAAVAAAGCSNVLGLKDPSLHEPGPGSDAAVDGATDAPIDTGPAACVPANCPFGCDSSTNACKVRLFAFLTTGQFFGDGIGGRGGADTKCFTTASAAFPDRACTAARTRAVISIDTSDNIQAMSALYMIPTDVEVHRIDDDVLVATNWNTFTAPSTAPITDVASATSASSSAASQVWTGFGGATASNCTNWTSKLSTVLGVRGTTRMPAMPATWLGEGSEGCNLLHRLLCICATKGN